MVRKNIDMLFLSLKIILGVKMPDFPYDPWQKCQTRSGLAADLVISALQKEIRRNHAENHGPVCRWHQHRLPVQ